MLDPGQIFHDPQVVNLARNVATGKTEVVERLLSAGIDARVKGEEGLTLPHFALYAGVKGPSVLKLLLRAGSDPISPLQNGNDLPHYAAARDDADPEFLKALLDAGVSPNLIGGGDRNSLLSAAVSGRNAHIVSLLISRGADLNYNHPFVGTALHTAMRIADYRIATILLEHGADPTLRDKSSPQIEASLPRRTPMDLYCIYQSGIRDPPTAEQVRDFEAMKTALSKRGASLSCGI